MPLHDIHRALADRPNAAIKLRIADAVGTPRVLKHGMRKAWLTWKNLHGEVDLRELVLLNVLRDVAPEAFDFSVRNIDALRNVERTGLGTKEEANQRAAGLMATWAEVGKSADWDREAVFAILRVLDLDFIDDYAGIDRRRSASQSLHQPPPLADYLQRILAGEVDGHEIRDQDVLRQIRAWQGNDADEQLAGQMLDQEGFADKVEQFQSYVGDENALRLCQEYLALCLTRFREKADEDTCQGFSVVERFAAIGQCGGPEYSQWLLARIDEAFEVSLRMVHTLYLFAVHWTNGREEMRRCVAEGFIRRVNGDVAYLGRVLDPGYPYTLYHFLRFRKDYPVYNTPEEWVGFVPSLLASAETAPQVVIPHVVNLIIDDRNQSEFVPPSERPQYIFAIEYAQKLVPDMGLRRRLVNLLTSYTASEASRPESVARIRAVGANLAAFAEGHPDGVTPTI